MSQEDERTAFELCQTYSKQGQTASQPQLLLLTKLVEVSKAIIDHAYRLFVQTDPNATILQIYGNDGTPCRSRIRISFTVGSENCKREGGKTVELLVGASFCRRFVAGTLESSISLTDPLPMSYGKSAKANFACALDSYKTLRSMGHRGFAIEIKVFDRALFTALDSLFRQFHLHQRFQAFQANDPQALVLYLTEWTLTLPCVLHDFHNAVKWSLYLWFYDASILKDLHIGIESVRNGYDLIVDGLSPFLVRRLKFAAADDLPSQATLKLLWESLGVKPTIMAFLVKHQVLFRDGFLNVNDTDRASPDLLEHLYSTLLALWKFTQFTDSRWNSSGRAGRPIVAGILTGLRELVSEILDDEGSNYYLGGFRRVQGPVVHLVVTCCVSAAVTDGAYALLLHDDRLMKQLPAVTAALENGAAKVVAIDTCVWELYASVCEDISVRELRSGSIASSHIAMAFVWYRVFRRAKTLPWSLCDGSIEDNIRTLVAEPEPAEPVSAKLWKLLDGNFIGLARAVGAVNVLANASWSTRIIEQLHRHAAVAASLHAAYGLESIRVRAFIAILNNLIGTLKSKDDSAFHRELRTLQKLESRNPNMMRAHG
jgi:hypothetical protein